MTILSTRSTPTPAPGLAGERRRPTASGLAPPLHPLRARRCAIGLALVTMLVGARGAALEAEESPPRKTLSECLAIALEYHPTLHAADALVAAAMQRVRQAASGYLPQISGTFAADRRNTNATARTGANLGTQSQTFNFYDTGIGFSQVLFDFGRNLALIRAAQATERSSQADRDTQRETVRFNVKQSYFNLLAARRLLAVADETVRQNQKQLELAQAREQVGLAPKFDVTTAQVQLANAELDQITARNAVAVARENLRNALGLTGPLDFDIVDTLEVQPVEITETGALAAAYVNRPELRSLQEQQSATAQQIASLQRDYLPNLTGNGAYAWTGTDYPLQSAWSIGASVNLSLFNGGLTTAQIAEAEAILSRLRYDEDALRQNIALEVRQAALDLQRAAESIRVTEKGTQQARENLAIAEGRYTTGVGNIIELTIAQASLTSAEANYVRALYGYKISLAALERATAQSLSSG